MVNQYPPPRLHIILARATPRAVVIRRGPTDWFRLSLWHTENDTFEHGQWLKGKVFPYRSDLSPDGKLLLYFASKYNGMSRRAALGYTDTYTAISKPPYFTALALWPSRIGTWLGGGLFVDNRTVALNGCLTADGDFHPQHRPHKLGFANNLSVPPGDMPMYAQRLNRDGWVLQPEGAFKTANWQWGSDWRWGNRLVWNKQHPKQAMHVIMEWDMDAYSYALYDQQHDTETLLDNVSWADWDQRGRLVGARDGQIIAMNPEALNEDVTVLEDFNDQKPDPQPAPDWARKW